jgi:hypothetical protein
MALPSEMVHAQAPASQYGNGIVNAAGQWAQQVGTVGARANRNTADQLFQQALQHEAVGRATLNVGLLSQALTESQQGIKADDQARHFAQTSLQALKSGNSAGQVDLAGKYGTTEAEMQDLANNSSPYLPQVQSKMGGYGIKVDHDAAVIKTPFGTFPIDAGPADMAGAMGKIANALGFSASGVGAGVQSGLISANAIAAKAMADAKSAAANGGRAIASDSAGAAGAGGKDGLDKNAAAKDAKAASDAGVGRNAASGTAAATGLTAEQDLAAREAALNKSREEMLKATGTTDAFGDKNSDLFGIVHARYQEIRREGGFNEYGQRMAAVLH